MTTTDLDDLLNRTIQQVDAAAERQRTDDHSLASLGLTEPIEGHGDAWDDRIRVTVVDGRLTRCDLPSLARRLADVELAEHLITAVNQAIADYQDQLVAALADQQPDLSPLAGSLRAIQADAVRAVDAATEQLHEVLRRVGDR